MSEELEKNELEANDSESSSYLRSDWLLQNLVWKANYFGLEAGITLNVGGLIISGVLISGNRYYDEVVKQFKAGFSKEYQEIGEVLGDLIKKNAEPFPDFWAKFDPSKESKSEIDFSNVPYASEMQHIHLRDVKYLAASGGQLQLGANQLWRGKIDSVDGFVFGALSVNQ
jgi:hypothetical protein